MNCGYTGTNLNPNSTVPNWRVIWKNDDGDVVSNVTYNGIDIAHGNINGLQLLHDDYDLTSGNYTASLLVGPVNKTHNQSSYQCCFFVTSHGDVISNVGTITVVGKANNDYGITLKFKIIVFM